MQVFIISSARDGHTAPVKWALESVGIPTVCYEGFGWEEARKARIVTFPEVAVSLGGRPVNAGDTVWIRRIQPPSRHPGLHPADRKFAAGESEAFQRGLLLMLEAVGARCVNPWEAARLIDDKPRQLALARQCGISVPATIFGNDSSAIKEFVNQGKHVVYKSFYPHAWQNRRTGGSAICTAFDIGNGIEDWAERLTYAPGIYQHRVDKLFDVRLHIMGRELIAFSIETPAGTVDWRPETVLGRVRVEPIEVPAAVRRQVLAFAAAARIEFGCCDFAVDRSALWWFLEVNEQGQFLGIQHLLPGAGLFQQFLSLLVASRFPPEAFPPLEDFQGPADPGTPAPRFETEE